MIVVDLRKLFILVCLEPLAEDGIDDGDDEDEMDDVEDEGDGDIIEEDKDD